MVRKSVKYKVGNIVDTPKGKVKVLEYIPSKTLPNKKHTAPRVVIRFIESGAVCNVQVSNLIRGEVKDYRAKTVCGVGYLDTDLKIRKDEDTVIARAYNLWRDMLHRCYSGNQPSYEDCTVDVRWHSFKNFLNSIQELDGYDRWERGENMQLDKDIKVKGNRVYSADTCMFVTEHENLSEASNRYWHSKRSKTLSEAF